MIVINISRKLLKVVLMTILLGSLGFAAYKYLYSSEPDKWPEPPAYSIDQSDGEPLTAFLSSKEVLAGANVDIEMFDIVKGEVTKRVPSGDIIQKEACSYLEGITGMYVKVRAFPDKGLIVRIPLEPSVEVHNHWLDGLVDEIFVLFPDKGAPYLLVLDEVKRPLFYNFEGNTNRLMKILNLKQKSAR